MIKEIINSESIENKVIEFNVKNDKPIFFECRAIAMKRCITNLLNNACSYGDDKSSSREKKDVIDISIEDNGPGIDKIDYDKAIKPFIRLDSSRNQKYSWLRLRAIYLTRYHKQSWWKTNYV